MQDLAEQKNQGPIFICGEELELRGGRFEVCSINPKKNTITLRGLPAH